MRDEKNDYLGAQDEERGGMAAIVWPLMAIAATVACWLISSLLSDWVPR